MRIAALQMKAVAGDVEANMARIAAAAADAATGGASLLVVPELAVTGYGAGEAAFADLASPDPATPSPVSAPSRVRTASPLSPALPSARARRSITALSSPMASAPMPSTANPISTANTSAPPSSLRHRPPSLSSLAG